MKSTFDKNAEKFVNLMVEKIESLSMNWQKPWFSKVNSKQNFLPQNLTGRTYSGGNAFLLYFKQEKSIFCILEFNGSEMNVHEIIDRMESVGYITPNDFIIKQRERT